MQNSSKALPERFPTIFEYAMKKLPDVEILQLQVKF